MKGGGGAEKTVNRISKAVGISDQDDGFFEKAVG